LLPPGELNLLQRFGLPNPAAKWRSGNEGAGPEAMSSVSAAGKLMSN
jgi:hypothetical protein